MFGVSNGNRFVGVIKRGISGIQDAYNRQRSAIEERANQRLATAKTKLEKERIKSDLELEKLKLQREMYSAKAAVKIEKVAVAKAKREAGVVGIGERVGGFMHTAESAGKKFYKGLVPTPRRRTKRKR